MLTTELVTTHWVGINESEEEEVEGNNKKPISRQIVATHVTDTKTDKL